MKIGKSYEILEGLPPYGPMYIPITENGDKFYHEGFVVRFIRTDGTDWVANFKLGRTKFSFVTEFETENRVMVIAGGMGYLINPESEKPIETFRDDINQVLQYESEQLIISYDTGIEILDQNGFVWESPRISWDGIEDLELEGHILKGTSFDPTNESEEWVDFSINLETKEIIGGSYNENPVRIWRNSKKPWWQFW